MYTGPRAPEGTKPICVAPAPPKLGCGSIIHGITFDFNSAAIRADSEPVLTRLYDGLRTDRSASIVIEGHTSSEGTSEYNQSLSERRARAVVADLVRRGMERARLSPSGAGETRPIATNDDESGRSLNRRVEVRCQ
jgi:outer membrane protein OmpA-like peptidoglycan-associated protein